MERRGKLEALLYQVQYGNQSVSDAYEHLSRYLQPLPVEAVKYAPRTLWDIYQDSLKPDNDKRIDLPWRRLNSYMGGLRGGRLVVIGGETGHGKSSLAINMGLALAKTHKVGFFSLEMTGEEIMFRCYANLSGVAEEDLRQEGSFLTEEEKVAVSKAKGAMQSYRLMIDDSGDEGVDEIIEKIKADVDSEVIIVDHVHLVKGGGDNRTLELDNITRALKNVAMSRKIPVIALCQLRNRNGAQTMPTLEDIYWCGAIKQHGNQVIFIHDRDQDDEQIAIKLAKNRHGRKSGELAFRWEGDTCRLTEWEG